MPSSVGFMPTGQEVVAPLGYLIFCKQTPSECVAPEPPADIAEPAVKPTIELARPAVVPASTLVVMTATQRALKPYLPLARPDRAPVLRLAAFTQQQVAEPVEPDPSVVVTLPAEENASRTIVSDASFSLTAARWQELVNINAQVNSQVRAVRDDILYQRREWWSYPTNNAGDCEDYVLLKRKMLMDKGWPASKLLITVAKQWNGEGHAVLLVVTDKGEFVLDNMERDIVSWRDAPYKWVSRQSRENPQKWVNLDPSQMIRSAPAERVVSLENNGRQS